MLGIKEDILDAILVLFGIISIFILINIGYSGSNFPIGIFYIVTFGIMASSLPILLIILRRKPLYSGKLILGILFIATLFSAVINIIQISGTEGGPIGPYILELSIAVIGLIALYLPLTTYPLIALIVLWKRLR